VIVQENACFYFAIFQVLQQTAVTDAQRHN